MPAQKNFSSRSLGRTPRLAGNTYENNFSGEEFLGGQEKI